MQRPVMLRTFRPIQSTFTSASCLVAAPTILTRFYADKTCAILKQPVIVQNKPGANGNIAAETVARSKPDGYSLLFGPSAARGW
jgi:hypothetical protein